MRNSRFAWRDLRIAMALTVCVATTIHAADNWLRNGGFEAAEDGAVADWIASGAAGFRSDSAVAKDDAKSLRMECAAPRPLEAYIVQTGAIPTNVPAGATFLLSFWYKTDAVVFGENGWIGVRARFAAAGDTNGFGQALSVNDPEHAVRLEPSTEWKHVAKYLTAREALSVFEVRAGLYQCGGTVWFDGFNLCVLDKRRELTLFSLKALPPALDGRLNDACWNEAQMAMGFMPLGMIAPADPDTEVMSCYDRDRVYLGIACRHAGTDDRGSLDIYLDPSGAGESWYYFNVNRQGQCQARVISGNQTDSETAIAVVTAVGTSAEGWVMEISIPFAEFGATAPANNRHWGFNVVRHVEGGRDSSWAAVGYPYSQRALFGALQFYSGYDVAAQAFAWDGADRDPLMGRRTVSGLEIARQASGQTVAVNQPDLWTYDPYQAHLVSDLPVAPYREGLTPAMRSALPEFYHAAMGINRLLARRAMLDEKLGFAKRVEFYRQAPAVSGVATQSRETTLSPVGIERDASSLDRRLNDAFRIYGRAYGRNREHAATNAAALAGLPRELADLERCLTALDAGLDRFMAAAVSQARMERSWESGSLALPPDAMYLNDEGVSRRFAFCYYDEYHRMTGPREDRLEEAYNSLLGPFDSREIGNGFHHAPELEGPGAFRFAKYEALIADYQTNGTIGRFFTTVPFGYGALCSGMVAPWLVEAAKTNSDILLTSQDGYAHNSGWGPALNINNPQALDYMRGYLREMARQVTALADTHFFMTAQEGGYELSVSVGDLRLTRSQGYSPSGLAAFRRYLEERYGKVETLNARWRSRYAAFAEIVPPPDKHIQPPDGASGLRYEFERWQRVNFARYLGRIRDFLKEGAPTVPVMADPSHYLADMNGYLAYKEHVADIQSFHLNPSREEAMWVYLSTMNRVFGRVTGYGENYWGMFRRAHLNDERLAKRDVQRFFFALFMWDVRLSCWWPWHDRGNLDYDVYYNGAPCRLQYDQTILKWSTAAVPQMFARCRRIEKALIESRPEIPRTAIVQPCASVFTLASLGRGSDTPIFNHMFDLHNRLLQPRNLPHDYIPEEMVLDGKARLADYTLLFLPYAPYLSEDFSGRLKTWVENGGVLVAIGPFALWNECGHDLAPSESLFKTLFPKWRRTGGGDWDYTLDGGERTAPPAVTNVPHGRGRLAYLNCSLDVVLRNEALRTQLHGVLADSAWYTARTGSPDMELLVRDGDGGERYLGLCNRNVRWPTEAEVTVLGEYPNPLDILIPGWFPVTSTIAQGCTLLRVRLEPGEWTVIRLK
ncbi:MAG: beta-galactosidase [Kiritimatiellae bacterium]|nr:beta-galactosidase [Kiritimatiellia bacterium]